MASAGRLWVVGTPIGNLGDLSTRAAEALRRADLVAAEDTRTAQALLSHLGLSRALVSYFEGNEAARTIELVAKIRQGMTIALISESGMPLVSDPGARLVRACIEADLMVEVVPGPSAVLMAVVGSGIAADDFRFVGFLPRKGVARREVLKSLAQGPSTIVLFEAANRLARTLRDLMSSLGDRRAAVARELTKVHEQFVRGTLSELASKFADAPPRGEVTVVIEGGSERSERVVDEDDLEASLRAALDAGMTARDIYRLATELRSR